MGNPMQWKPNVTVAAVIKNADRFLLVEEKVDDHIVFNQPAGHLEKDEGLLDAVKREVLEETTRRFQPEALIGIYLYPNRFGNDITYLRFCFAGLCLEPEEGRSLDAEIIRTVWLSRTEIRQQNHKLRSPLVLKCIDDCLSGKRYPLDILDHSLL